MDCFTFGKPRVINNKTTRPRDVEEEDFVLGQK